MSMKQPRQVLEQSGYLVGLDPLPLNPPVARCSLTTFSKHRRSSWRCHPEEAWTSIYGVVTKEFGEYVGWIYQTKLDA